jgi:hypothetical protein
MIAGFVVLGIAAGLVSGGSMLIAGHSLGMAALAYVFGGMLGFGLGIAVALRAEGADSAGPDVGPY